MLFRSEFTITDRQQDGIALNGVNPIRTFVGRGILAWGARTMGSDPDFKYVNVRRFLMFLERSIDVGTQWVREIEGVPMRTYIDWMATCYAISCTGLPAISVPCGFTEDGLPVGLQIVGKYRGERDLLAFARMLERANPAGRRRPPGM